MCRSIDSPRDPEPSCEEACPRYSDCHDPLDCLLEADPDAVDEDVLITAKTHKHIDGVSERRRKS